MGQQFLDHQQALSENNSIRNKPLDPEFVDKYLQKNRHRVKSVNRINKVLISDSFVSEMQNRFSTSGIPSKAYDLSF